MSNEAEYDDTIRVYKRLIKTKFPTVYVRMFMHNGTQLIEAFNVPDDSKKNFMIFILGELSNMLEKEGLPFIGIMPYSVTNTKKYFPELSCED